MSSSQSSSISIPACVFALSAAVFVGYRNINRQLKHLQTEIIQCNRRDFTTRLEVSNENIFMKKTDLLLELHSVISHENVEGNIKFYYFIISKSCDLLLFIHSFMDHNFYVYVYFLLYFYKQCCFVSKHYL